MVSPSHVDKIIQKIKHFLISLTGKTLEEASKEEFYLAFCFSLREEIMVHWSANLHSIEKNKCKIVYYMSMEYLPGKITGSSLSNLNGWDLVKEILAKTNRNLSDFVSCEPDPGLGNGGLGRLASCLLESLASHHYPAFGYGLRYQYGIFEQELWEGKQIERPDCWLLFENPWEFRKDLEDTFIHFKGNIIKGTNSHGDIADQLYDAEVVRALPYDTPIVGHPNGEKASVISLRLWSTKESPRNFALQRFNAGQLDEASENTSLTDVLYPNDNHDVGKRIRLKQEFLLVSSSVKDIIRRHIKIYGDLQQFPEKVAIQINDTHPALVVVELIRILTKNYDIPFHQAFEITKACCSYTNHTIMREALEEWNEMRLQELLPRQYILIQKLNQMFCSDIRKSFPKDEDKVKRMSFIEEGQIKMSHLAIYGSKKVNGVAELHTEILTKTIFKDFYDLYPDRFLAITNGVTHRRWLVHANPLLTEFITNKIGDNWIKDFSEIKNLAEHASDESAKKEFLEIKQKNKELLTDLLLKFNPIRDSLGKIIGHSQILPPTSLFDMQIKRIHEYKRPLLNILHVIMLMHELQENPTSERVPRLVIIGGKAAPGYSRAKAIIQLAFALGRKLASDPNTKERLQLVFIENYNVSKAQLLIPAADLSQQISMAGMEASGTGNMKLAMNGALTIGTEDGANIEMRKSITDQWWPFSFGSSAQEIFEARINNSYEAKKVYSENPAIQKAVDALGDRSIAINEKEHNTFSELKNSLLEDTFSIKADKYFTLKDLTAYFNTQKKVEELYKTPDKWAEYAIHNIAGMGPFSADYTIHKYAKKIWNLQPCLTDSQILSELKKEFAEHQLFK